MAEVLIVFDMNNDVTKIGGLLPLFPSLLGWKTSGCVCVLCYLCKRLKKGNAPRFFKSKEDSYTDPLRRYSSLLTSLPHISTPSRCDRDPEIPLCLSFFLIFHVCDLPTSPHLYRIDRSFLCNVLLTHSHTCVTTFRALNWSMRPSTYHVHLQLYYMCPFSLHVCLTPLLHPPPHREERTYRQVNIELLHTRIPV